MKIEESFKMFLINNKNYNSNDIITNVTIHEKRERRQIDVLIKQRKSNNYIAIVEIKKTSPTKENINSALKIVRSYKNFTSLKNAKTYIVFLREENSWIIYEVNQNNIEQIDEKDFPDYETLANNVVSNIKLNEEIKEMNEKKNNYRLRIITSLIAIILVLVGFIYVSIVYDSNEQTILFEKIDQYINKTNKEIQVIENRIERLNEENKKIDERIDNLKLITSEEKKGQISVDLAEEISKLDKRINSNNERISEIIELLEVEPIEAYKIKDVTSQLEKYEQKVELSDDLLKEKIIEMNKRISILFNLLYATIGAIIAIAITNLLTTRKDKYSKDNKN